MTTNYNVVAFKYTGKKELKVSSKNEILLGNNVAIKTNSIPPTDQKPSRTNGSKFKPNNAQNAINRASLMDKEKS